MNPDSWYADAQWLPFQDLKLCYKVVGNGSPVLVLHAFPTSSYDFSRVVPLLSNQFQFILFDYPGFGHSDKPRKFPYSLFTYADAALHLLNHLHVNPTRILAHDIGDSVALGLLSRDVLSIEKLVMLNGSVYSITFDDWRMLLTQKLLLNPISGEFIDRLRVIRKPMLKAFFADIFVRQLSQSEVDAFWSLLTYQDGLKNYHHLMGYMPERWQHQEQWLQSLSDHSTAVMLIWGEDDPVANPEVADVIIQYRPDTVDIRLEGVGHYPHWEVPERVAAAISDGLA